MGMIPGGGGDVPSPRQDMRRDFISPSLCHTEANSDGKDPALFNTTITFPDNSRKMIQLMSHTISNNET